MISLDKLKILTPLQKLPMNVVDLDKIFVATDFEKLPIVQKIAQSGHAGLQTPYVKWFLQLSGIVYPVHTGAMDEQLVQLLAFKMNWQCKLQKEDL